MTLHGLNISGTHRGAWAASTAYNANDIVLYNGVLYTAKTAFTSGTTFNATNWNTGSPGPAGADGAAGVGGLVPGGLAAITANVTGITTTIVDVAGLSITVTGNSQRMMIEVWIGGVQNSVAGSGVTIYITDDANTILSRGDLICPTAGSTFGPVIVKFPVPAFTGSKTFKVRGQAVTSGSVTLLAGGPRQAYIEATYR